MCASVHGHILANGKVSLTLLLDEALREERGAFANDPRARLRFPRTLMAESTKCGVFVFRETHEVKQMLNETNGRARLEIVR